MRWSECSWEECVLAIDRYNDYSDSLVLSHPSGYFYPETEPIIKDLLQAFSKLRIASQIIYEDYLE
jgi:hypothetical protein